MQAGSMTTLAVGDPMTLDQIDDLFPGDPCEATATSHTDGGGIFVSHVTNYGSNGEAGGAPRYSGNNGACNQGRGQQQIVIVTSIHNNGNGTYSVGINPPLADNNWNNHSNANPQAWWPNDPITFVGVEDVSVVQASGPAHAVLLHNCTNCWVSGIRSVGPTFRDHVDIYQSAHATVQNSYFYFTGSGQTTTYGVETFPASDCLVINNIFQQVQVPYPSNGTATGCVFAYNFDVDNVFPQTGFLSQSGYSHATGVERILYEGNIGAGVYYDNFHGTHPLITTFRNYWNGDQQNLGIPSSAHAEAINAQSRFSNSIGNVLGNPAASNSYDGPYPIFNNSLYGCNGPGPGGIQPCGYDGGHPGQIGGGENIPFDPYTPQTLMRWGNFANCSTSGGDAKCQTSVFSTTEVPTSSVLNAAQQPFANFIPSCNSASCFGNYKSFFLSSQPSWWPAGKPWPPIGPEVTGGNLYACTAGTYNASYVPASSLSEAQTLCGGSSAALVAGGRVYSNPALDCYYSMSGAIPNGTGSALNFSAAACYGSSGGTTGGLNPPSGLRAVVN